MESRWIERNDIEISVTFELVINLNGFHAIIIYNGSDEKYYIY
jgi:hypothetical protein